MRTKTKVRWFWYFRDGHGCAIRTTTGKKPSGIERKTVVFEVASYGEARKALERAFRREIESAVSRGLRALEQLTNGRYQSEDPHTGRWSERLEGDE